MSDGWCQPLRDLIEWEIVPRDDGHEVPSWAQRAGALVDEVLEHGDDNGALANATADDLRDALHLAADRLRILGGRPPRGAWMIGCRRLVAEVWDLVHQRKIDARSPAADASLDLRDMIDTQWQPDVVEERARFHSR